MPRVHRPRVHRRAHRVVAGAPAPAAGAVRDHRGPRALPRALVDHRGRAVRGPGAPPVRRPEIATRLVLSLLGFAYGAVAHAASPEPPASAAHVDHLILGTRDLDEGIGR